MRDLTLLAVLLYAPVALALGDATVFADALLNVNIAYKNALGAAQLKLSTDNAGCAKVAAWKKRDQCFATAQRTFDSAVLAAGVTQVTASTAAAATYYQVTAAELPQTLQQLAADQFARDFAIQQAKIDACIAANPGLDPNEVCNDLHGY